MPYERDINSVDEQSAGFYKYATVAPTDIPRNYRHPWPALTQFSGGCGACGGVGADSVLSAIPWWGWLAAAAGAYFLLRPKVRRNYSRIMRYRRLVRRRPTKSRSRTCTQCGEVATKTRQGMAVCRLCAEDYDLMMRAGARRRRR